MKMIYSKRSVSVVSPSGSLIEFFYKILTCPNDNLLPEQSSNLRQSEPNVHINILLVSKRRLEWIVFCRPLFEHVQPFLLFLQRPTATFSTQSPD